MTTIDDTIVADDKPREYSRRGWNRRASWDQGWGGPPRVGSRGRALLRPAIALRGRRGLAPHRVRQQLAGRPRRCRPKAGGIPPEESPHPPLVLARRVQLRVRRRVVQDQAVDGDAVPGMGGQGEPSIEGRGRGPVGCVVVSDRRSRRSLPPRGGGGCRGCHGSLGGPRKEGVGDANGAAEQRIQPDNEDDDEDDDNDNDEDPCDEWWCGPYVMPLSNIEGGSRFADAVLDAICHASCALAAPSSELASVLVSFALPLKEPFVMY